MGLTGKRHVFFNYYRMIKCNEAKDPENVINIASYFIFNLHRPI